MTLATKFTDVESSMQNLLLERDDEIHTSLLALLTNSHHFQYGEPGVAKSMLVNILCEHIEDLNGDSFQYLLTKYTTPEEIAGIVDLKAFRDGVFRKITDRKLPEARVAFLDETFNGSSAILNTLLEILNERRFDRGDEVVEVPLISLFGASNSIPHNSELRALADRLHFWHHVQPVQDPSSRAKLLAMDVEGEPTAFLTLEDIEAAQVEVAAVKVDDSVIATMLDIYDDLTENGVHVTDRRFRHALQIIKAEAWMKGRNEASRKDIRPLQFMFWQVPEQIPTVTSVVMNNISVIASELNEIRHDVSAMMAAVKETVKNSSERVNIVSQGSEAASKLSAARDDVKKLREKDGLDEDDHKDIKGVQKYIQQSYEYIQREIFHIEDMVDPSVFEEDS